MLENSPPTSTECWDRSHRVPWQPESRKMSRMVEKTIPTVPGPQNSQKSFLQAAMVKTERIGLKIDLCRVLAQSTMGQGHHWEPIGEDSEVSVRKEILIGFPSPPLNLFKMATNKSSRKRDITVMSPEGVRRSNWWVGGIGWVKWV